MIRTQLRWPLALAVLGLACGADAPVERPVRRSGASPVQFPRELWDLGIEGQTIVAAHVSARGTVESAHVYHSSGYAAFDSAAVAGTRALRFVPARQGDRRIDMWVRLPVRFRRPRASASPGASSAPSGSETPPTAGARP